MTLLQRFLEWFRYPQTCTACERRRQPGEPLFKYHSSLYYASGPECPSCFSSEDPYQDAEDERIERLLREEQLECRSVIYHGPGHQSKTCCELTGAHGIHRSTSTGRLLEWMGEKAFTDYFDQCKSVE